MEKEICLRGRVLFFIVWQRPIAKMDPGDSDQENFMVTNFAPNARRPTCVVSQPSFPLLVLAI